MVENDLIRLLILEVFFWRDVYLRPRSACIGRARGKIRTLSPSTIGFWDPWPTDEPAPGGREVPMFIVEPAEASAVIVGPAACSEEPSRDGSKLAGSLPVVEFGIDKSVGRGIFPSDVIA